MLQLVQRHSFSSRQERAGSFSAAAYIQLCIMWLVGATDARPFDICCVHKRFEGRQGVCI